MKHVVTDGVGKLRDEYSIARNTKDKTKAKIRSRYHFANLKHIREDKYECQLYRGQEKFPRQKEMTIFEVGRANREFVLSQIRQMDKGHDRPLYLWRIIERDAVEKRRKEISYRLS